MPAAKKTTASKKVATRAKPKSAKNATAKRVKRSTATRSTADGRKRAANSASAASTRSTARKQTAASQSQEALQQSDAIMRMGTDTIRQMLSGLSDSSMQDGLQKQMMSMSQEGAQQLAKSADAASRSMTEIFSLSKDNIDACVTCSSIAVNASKSIGAEIFNYANKSFSQNVEMSKEVFGCRTINDMFDLQSKVVKANLDHFFNESVKMSEMMFQCANEVSEPINQRVSQNTDRLSKVLGEAA